MGCLVAVAIADTWWPCPPQFLGLFPHPKGPAYWISWVGLRVCIWEGLGMQGRAVCQDLLGKQQALV